MSRWGPLADAIPWDWLRAQYRAFRAALFTSPRPEGEYLRVRATPEDIRHAFGTRSYAPNWEMSYHKRGEIINLARVVWHIENDHPEYRWWQTHVRGWRHDDTHIDLGGHWELEPTETDKAHINGVGFNRERGMEAVEEVLAVAGLEYERVQWRNDD